MVPPAVIPASPSRRHSVHVGEDFTRQRKGAASPRHVLCMINGLIYTFILLICNPWTRDCYKDPQECRASSLHPLLHVSVNTWVCLAVQSAGCWQRGLTPGHAILPFPEHRVQSCRCLFTDAFTTFPFSSLLMPLTSFPTPHVPLPFSLARCQPSPALPTASKPWSIPFSMAVLHKYWK